MCQQICSKCLFSYILIVLGTFQGSPLVSVSAREISEIHLHSHNRTETAVGFHVFLPSWWAPKQEDWADPPPSGVLAAEARHQSQDKEDEIVHDTYFYGMTNLFYMEMGALDGVRYSNTKYLRDALSWKGLLIEANPQEYTNLVNRRKSDICVNAAVCDFPRNVHYVINNAMGGILEFMVEEHKRIWKPELHQSIPISCLPMNTILSKLSIYHIDFWSLDVEGAELKVLQTFNWNGTTVNVIVVEADGKDKAKDLEIVDLLVAAGYVYDGKKGRNDWFHHKSFVPSVKP